MDPINEDEQCRYRQNEDENEPVGCVREEKRSLEICNPDKTKKDAIDSLLEATGGNNLNSNNEYVHGTSSSDESDDDEEYVDADNNPPNMEEDLEAAEDTLVPQPELPSSTKSENGEPEMSGTNEHITLALLAHNQEESHQDNGSTYLLQRSKSAQPPQFPL